MSERESETISKLRRHLVRNYGAYVNKNEGTARRAGRPDLEGCIGFGVLRGMHFGIEAKAVGSSHKTSRRQGVELDRIRRAGGIAFTARTTGDIDEQFALAELRTARS